MARTVDGILPASDYLISIAKIGSVKAMLYDIWLLDVHVYNVQWKTDSRTGSSSSTYIMVDDCQVLSEHDLRGARLHCCPNFTCGREHCACKAPLKNLETGQHRSRLHGYFFWSRDFDLVFSEPPGLLASETRHTMAARWGVFSRTSPLFGQGNTLNNKDKTTSPVGLRQARRDLAYTSYVAL